MNGRLFIVSNRLPMNVKVDGSEIEIKESLGGLATGLKSFYKEKDGRWIGWPGFNSDEASEDVRNRVESALIKENCLPVFVPKDEFEGYYDGFSNQTLWPLLHYFSERSIYKETFWQKYKFVNEKFAAEILKYARPDDTVWIQDYHLTLLPKLLRDEIPDLNIGFFLHIPFPSSELFRALPWRNEVLSGMLGADLIGFHSYDYVRHFISSVRRIVGYEHVLGEIKTKDRLVKVDTFPIGIDFEKFANAGKEKQTLKEAEKFREMTRGRKTILTIDRLDYTKGIPHRLEAFDAFLEKYPDYQGKVSLVMISAPSRTEVKSYKELKIRVDELVGKINGKYGSIGWTPVNYFYRSFSQETLKALYLAADVCMVTPVRDGMNLVAKEFVATKPEGKPGALILSETAGAAQELSEAVVVNPNNKIQIADAIAEALGMPENEQIERLNLMRNRVRRYDIDRWADDFLKELKQIKKKQKGLLSKELNARQFPKILKKFQEANKRLFLLDYDGTLVDFVKDPKKANPDKELIDLLSKLAADERNQVYVISGRDRKSLEKWIGSLDVGIIAEHGVWIKIFGEEWKTIFPPNDDRKKEIQPVLQFFTDRTPGSFVEEKDYSLVWHYRKVNPALAGVRVNELKEYLLNLTGNLSIGVLDGNKVVEIKNNNINKGSAANYVINLTKPDFIFSVGDDVTDEDMFRELQGDAVTVRVGFVPTNADYNLRSPKEVRTLLNKFEGK